MLLLNFQVIGTLRADRHRADRERGIQRSVASPGPRRRSKSAVSGPSLEPGVPTFVGEGRQSLTTVLH